MSYPNGDISTLEYPVGGLTLQYDPNALGQPTRAGDFATGVQYWPNGAIKQFTYGNGIVHTMTQNARQLPHRSIDSLDVLDLTFSYDANGNVSSISDSTFAARQSRTMTYDGRDRLTGVTSPMYVGGASYAYDGLDNLARVTVAGRDHTYHYDTANRLTNVMDYWTSSSVMGLGYDVRGNLANRNGQLYQFDHGNRLRSAIGSETYRYDAHGRRIQTLSSTGSLYEVYSNSGKLLFQRDEAVGLRFLHVWLGDSIIASRRLPIGSSSFDTTYRHTDALGTPIAATNDIAALNQTTENEPYGKMLNRVNDNRPGYTGHMMDRATGLVYMQQRYYDPQLGVFLSVDPVTAYSNPISQFHRYRYGNNNPYSLIDPDGRQVAIPWGQIGEIAAKRGTQAAIASQVDSPAPGPGDVVGVIILIGAVGEVGYTIWQANQSGPEAPGNLVGVQDDKSGVQGGRHNSGPLSPDSGGTGDAGKDFDKLTGGKSGPAPEGSRYPAGTQVGDNGIALRPEAGNSGPRIDIPAQGDKPHETLHYPKQER